jgi:hypothetical protein
MKKQSFGGLLALTTLLSVGACSDSAGPGTSPVVLLSDDFSDSSPGNSNWLVIFSIREGFAGRDTTVGNPRPSFSLSNFCKPIPFTDPKFDQCETTAVGATTTNNMSRAADQGLSVAADILLQPVAGTGTVAAGFSVNSTTGSYGDIGTIQWGSITIDLARSVETYAICKSQLVACISVAVPFSPDVRFHTYRFLVDANGSARWERDGLTQFSGGVESSGLFLITLYSVASDLPGARHEYPIAYFDNVLVTRP